MLCEMCGKDVVATARVRLEGTVLPLCPECARFGQPVDPPPTPAPAPAGAGGRPSFVGASRTAPRARRLEERDLYTEIGEMELAPDWAKRVRVAREGLAWTPEELGKKLNEKKSVVLKIEAGSFRPPDALVRKIEHLLKVRLRADPDPGPG
ncbi:MAG TPA: multiprotein-bridging factor 1 family protein [Thermoplasmata archaeon]|jgi:putative transcription factor|nr:multiprotein-bridging factor 1 family protein [Thermoplasmata archaeon]